MFDSEVIKVNSIIDIHEPNRYKLHAARWNNKDQPLDVYVRDRNEWFYWNRWRNNKDEFSRDYIFSLIDFYHETDTWLFGGIYKVVGRSNTSYTHSYEIEEVDDYKALVGRLKII